MGIGSALTGAGYVGLARNQQYGQGLADRNVQLLGDVQADALRKMQEQEAVYRKQTTSLMDMQDNPSIAQTTPIPGAAPVAPTTPVQTPRATAAPVQTPRATAAPEKKGIPSVPGMRVPTQDDIAELYAQQNKGWLGGLLHGRPQGFDVESRLNDLKRGMQYGVPMIPTGAQAAPTPQTAEPVNAATTRGRIDLTIPQAQAGLREQAAAIAGVQTTPTPQTAAPAGVQTTPTPQTAAPAGAQTTPMPTTAAPTSPGQNFAAVGAQANGELRMIDMQLSQLRQQHEQLNSLGTAAGVQTANQVAAQYQQLVAQRQNLQLHQSITGIGYGVNPVEVLAYINSTRPGLDLQIRAVPSAAGMVYSMYNGQQPIQHMQNVPLDRLQSTLRGAVDPAYAAQMAEHAMKRDIAQAPNADRFAIAKLNAEVDVWKTQQNNQTKQDVAAAMGPGDRLQAAGDGTGTMYIQHRDGGVSVIIPAPANVKDGHAKVIRLTSPGTAMPSGGGAEGYNAVMQGDGWLNGVWQGVPRSEQ